jgi:hypothetical protein
MHPKTGVHGRGASYERLTHDDDSVFRHVPRRGRDAHCLADQGEVSIDVQSRGPCQSEALIKGNGLELRYRVILQGPRVAAHFPKQLGAVRLTDAIVIGFRHS